MLQIDPDSPKSFFLFGPRGTGKTTWLKTTFPDALYLDLLFTHYQTLLSNPSRLESLIPPNFNQWIILDEIQKIPALLDEVHRLIESKKFRFILTGSSARSLRKKGVNLLAGRALTYHMHPLTAPELGRSFSLSQSLKLGHLPSVFIDQAPGLFLKAYVQTYLREEVLQEGLTRNIAGFSRFLETASFSQGSVINMQEIAREVGIDAKQIAAYFEILEDLLLASRIPPFTKRAKRRLVAHPKFYFFDTGVFRAIRPQGLIDSIEELEGACLETLCYQELRAINDYLQLDYTISYWRTSNGLEVDFILYGPNGFKAIEVKRSAHVDVRKLSGLTAFCNDYPEAKAYVFYTGKTTEYHGPITYIPIDLALQDLPKLLTE
jgi:predicted AAA+ superfamily ATPase